MGQRRCSKAIAKICGGVEYPQLHGMVCFLQRNDGVMVEVEIHGLPKTETSFFAFHIHEGSSCKGAGFPDTGSHLNPGNTMHPQHAGDLPPLLGNDGKAYMKVLTDRFRVEDIIGKTVIVHSDPDDFHTQPSGNAGTKIACGIIKEQRNG